MTTMVNSSPIAMSPSDSSDLSLDSPSRQLLRELRLLQIWNRNSFYERLEENDLNLAREHNAGLAAAAARHEQVRRDAEEMLKQYNRELERQRKQEEEERRRREETIQREKRAQEEAEDRRRQEAERRRAEEAARRAAEEKAEAEAAERDRLEAKRKQEEERARQKQEAEQRAAEAAAAEAKAKAEKESAKKEEPVVPGPKVDNEAEHERYLAIHQDLKKFRVFIKEEQNKNKDFKTRTNNLRRTARKCVSQLTNVKGANKKPQAEIFEVLREAATVHEPTVDVRRFLTNLPPQLASSPQMGPALLVFLLNMFSKFCLEQFMKEGAVSTKSADPIGILIAQVFSTPEFKYQGQYTMIDILIAKFHFLSPVAWGIWGVEGNTAGMRRMGWRVKEGGNARASIFYDRMTGLGAGFASLALRNFENSKNPNPFPNSNYWRALGNIINVPPKDIQPTHLVFLKAMIEGQEERILTFFGSAGKAALRKALLDFPASVPEQTAYTRSLTLLAEIMAKEKNIHL